MATAKTHPASASSSEGVTHARCSRSAAPVARTLKRWGTCRLVESEPDDPQPFHLQVRPAIVEIVGEQWLQRLDQHNRDDDADAADNDDVMEDGDAAA